MWGSLMAHERIRQKAEFIDQFILYYRQSRKRTRFPHKAAGQLIKLLFRKSSYLGAGAHKSAFYVPTRKKDLVLKISETKNLKNDFRVYRHIPSTIRNRYFAKMYWATTHCLLQKWAKQPEISKKDPRIIKLKKKLKLHGLTDIRPANVGFIDGKLKVLDASLCKGL